MIRYCYLFVIMLTISTFSNGQHANVHKTRMGTSTLIRNGNGNGNSSNSVGDPSIFGQNVWNVYAWNSTGSDSWDIGYAGYYVDTALTMNTLDYWDGGLSPSYALNYQGDTVTDEYHSFSGKRRGFPFGRYQINIPAHDDYAYVLIDGVEVWNHEGCCDAHNDVWEGVLNDSSTIEFRVMEFGGGSYGIIEVIPLVLTGHAAAAFIQCPNGTTDLTISATGGFPPYTGLGTFTVSAGTYSYNIVDSLGNTALFTVEVPDAQPDSIITTSAPANFCEGDTITLTGPAYGSALNFTGGSQRVVIPFNSPETDYTYELDFKTTEPNIGISSVRDGDLSGNFDRDLYISNGQIFHRLWAEETINSYSQNYADGQWHHVAVVVESGVGQRIYVDGFLVATGVMDHSDFNWDNTINVGYGNGWMDGSIDNIRIWNVVRTPAEIIQDQTLYASGSIAGLIGNWNFDQSVNDIVVNTVDNSEATLVDGMSLSSHNSNTYLWSTGETTESITAFATGSFSVTATTVNGCVVNSPVTELTMFTYPTAPVISTSSALAFCEGGTAEFTSSVSQGNQWNKNGIALSNDTNATLTVSESGIYSVTITNGGGCSRTSNEETVEVYAAPLTPVIDPAGAAPFCDGSSVDLSVLNGIADRRFASSVISFSTEYDPYDWGIVQVLGAPDVYPVYGDIETAWAPAEMDEPGEFLELGFSHPVPINFIDIYETLGPGTIDSVFVKNPGTGLYENVYTAIPGYAGDSARMLHITFPTTTFPVSEVRITMDMSAVADWNEIDAVAIGNSTPSSYLWSTGESTPIINVSTSENLTVSITNALGCISVSDPISTTMNPNPVVYGGPDMYSGECNTTFTLNGGTPTGGIYSGTGVNGAYFTPSIGVGTYLIKYSYTDANGCKGSAITPMTVVPAPVVSLPAFSNMCTDDQPLVLNGGLPAGGVYSGTGITNNTFDPTIGAGTYAIHYSYEDAYGCSQEAIQNITVDICTGISSAERNKIASIYPNPVHGKAKIEFSSDEELLSLEFYNATGSIELTKAFNEIKSLKQFEIDLSEFPAGAYLLRIITKNGYINKRVIVQ